MSSIAQMHRSRTVISEATTPVTVFTGFLGAGKTTLIFNLIKRADPDYKIVLLKNEFGDAETDSALARESHIEIAEMTNGCLCCVLVGQMKRALEELKEKYQPDRIIIETSGSAFPAPIAWQIREMEPSGFHLDSILTVIDCVNFCGYEDTSYTARMQAQYTDLIILNKWEQVSERQLDIVIDHVNDLNTDTPKIKAHKDVGIDPAVVFGLDTTLFRLSERPVSAAKGESGETDSSSSVHLPLGGHDHHAQEVDLVEVRRSRSDDGAQHADIIDTESFVAFLKSLPADDVYRVKGIVRLSNAVADESSADVCDAGHATAAVSGEGILYIVNHAFGRYTFTRLTLDTDRLRNTLVRVTVMGSGLRMLLPKLQSGFRAADDEISTHWACTH
ncbi:CobW/HypB/UreG, nucleotide-binding domain-containing protein [Kickxella alabastrina]|uniref:CobW/HypB/UreG, nucleotide-binding domain-containing protein n=1 Tax=Kickxella alabastrina TaxID=61397 RepID=UPI00221E9781|nr:CobW/HypB/UreG, nucleotide-binding domain-containing protein [Kickxella alabastrina]KAI7829158.1 CobW/HypB/UreG, nucleotide-binding domain-containing protein [Kickxella alabastrina]KAJ1936235.1 hypothetical protein GGF37_005690 [Kickxella alabastrina]